jgi:hypothetical protein
MNGSPNELQAVRSSLQPPPEVAQHLQPCCEGDADSANQKCILISDVVTPDSKNPKPTDVRLIT